MRALEIAALLAADAESVARKLLPSGKRDGQEWVCGDLDGSSGKSLKLRLTGAKAGVWKDFATDEGGDLIGLWMQTQGVSLAEACREAKEYLGVEERKVQGVERVYSKPSREGVAKPTDLALEFFRKRAIPAETVSAYKVATKNGALMFPYLVGGELVFAKYRDVSQKKFWAEGNCEPCLFGWQVIPADARTVVITEGELDAMALHAYGIPALSLPFGGGSGDKQRWIDSEFDRLAVFDEITLCLDHDKAGHEAEAEIVARLGRERVRIARLPHKDANDCLMEGVEEAAIRECITNAKTLDPERLRSASDYTDEVRREFENAGQPEYGIRLPWSKADGLVVLRPGELSIWAGINGHGKSQVTGQITIGAMKQDFRTCVASLEFKPGKYLKRIVRQSCATGQPTAASVDHAMKFLGGRMWLYDQTGHANTGSLIEAFTYAARRYGVKFFVVDNLAKCGFGEDDYNGQKGFVDALSDLARDLDVHVALVCHTRKTERGEEQPPRKHDIKGSGGITDMAQTVFTIWRNKPKEAEARSGNADPSQPDCVLLCHKQNNGEHEPVLNLWFDQHSCQYHGNPNEKVRPLVLPQVVGGVDL